ncbi:hypothetical protein DUNSADRAFT_6132, partial [Dunaliella salina]
MKEGGLAIDDAAACGSHLATTNEPPGGKAGQRSDADAPHVPQSAQPPQQRQATRRWSSPDIKWAVSPAFEKSHSPEAPPKLKRQRPRSMGSGQLQLMALAALTRRKSQHSMPDTLQQAQ